MGDVEVLGWWKSIGNKWLYVKTDSTLVQFFRYTFVGGTAFIVDFSALVFLTSIVHVHYLYSAALAFILGLFVNYALSVTWVFSERSLSNRYLEFVTFTWIGVVGLGINELLMWLLTDKLFLHYAGSKCVSAVIVFLWNFISRKLILFRGAKNVRQ